MLVRTMLQEGSRDVGTKRIVCGKVYPDYVILLRLVVGLRPDTRQRNWIREQGAEELIVDIGKNWDRLRQKSKLPFRCLTMSMADQFDFESFLLYTHQDGSILLVGLKDHRKIAWLMYLSLIRAKISPLPD